MPEEGALQHRQDGDGGGRRLWLHSGGVWWAVGFEVVVGLRRSEREEGEKARQKVW